MDILGIVGMVLFLLIFCVSTYFNFFLLKRLIFFNENIENIVQTIDGFLQHIESVHEMQMYYGDQTLQDLILHSKELKVDLQNFRDAYYAEKTTQENKK